MLPYLVVAFLVAAFLVVVFLVADFLEDAVLDAEALVAEALVDVLDAVLEAVRFLRFTGPAARFCASKSKASCGWIESGVYCFGKVRLVSPSVI